MHLVPFVQKNFTKSHILRIIPERKIPHKYTRMIPQRFRTRGDDYVCPFCLFASGVASPMVHSVPEDIVYRDEDIMVFISTVTWEGNSGNVLIIPVRHFEGLYELDDAVGARISRMSRLVATAMMEAYGCDGITVRQHNGEGCNQDVFHYHLHVIPRKKHDDLHLRHTQKISPPPEERARYADILRAALRDYIG